MNDALKILEVLERLATKATNVLQYRALVSAAVARGDLDVTVGTYTDAASRANAFVEGGQ